MAFCKFCGNKLADDSVFCSSCGGKVETEAPKQESEIKTEPAQRQFSYGFSSTQSVQAPEVEKPSGIYGLGKAIAGAVCALVSFIIAVVAEMMFVMTDDYGYYNNIDEEIAAVTVVFSIIAMAVGIVGIVFGAKSIKNFKYAKNTWGTKPIATLVLGIAGLSYAVISVFIALCFIFAGSLYM